MQRPLNKNSFSKTLIILYLESSYIDCGTLSAQLHEETLAVKEDMCQQSALLGKVWHMVVY